MKNKQYYLLNMSESVADQYKTEKLDWIVKNASDRLQKLVAAGYEGNELYISERLLIDFPEFELATELSIIKADSPPEFYLLACQDFTGAYCSVTKYASNETFYITIDNFLGGISIAKKIRPPVVVIEDEDFDILTQSNPIVQSEDYYTKDKREWILLCGSDLLRQSFLDGYNCEERYINERANSDFPGFTFSNDSFEKVDSPDEYLFQQCYSIPGSYCGNDKYSKSEYYTIVDNYLGKHTIIKSIPDLEQTILTQSNSMNHSISRNYPVLIIFTSVVALLVTFTNFSIFKPISIPPNHEKSSSPIRLILK